ncbi:MAG: GatB/YqeY domain-containing protein [Ignavibacteria bacterium]|jgi:uncharacterized protein YqeY|nr:GatB/YqeY domain-containing protein [Ignavibacteria bacterium]
MALEQTINEALKKAMKNGDKIRTTTLRSIRASIIEFNKSGVARAMTEDDELKILNSAAKKRKDAIEMYQNAGRTDLANNEQAELDIIQEFLPKQMTEEEITNAIKAIIEKIGAKDIKDVGKVMGSAMKELKGKADGSIVQKIVKDLLAN